jgi:hypothetical protein
MPVEVLELELISTNPLTQGRIEIDTRTIDRYLDALENGEQFPPIRVVWDAILQKYWLADGYHRYHAYRRHLLYHIEADITEGSLTDAIAIACGANGNHGLPRTQCDKLRQATIYFAQSPEWANRSNREIGRILNISHTAIANYRREITNDSASSTKAWTNLALNVIEAAKNNLALAEGQPIAATRGGKELAITRPPVTDPKYLYTGNDRAIEGSVTQVAQSLTRPNEISVKDESGKFHRVDRGDLATLPDTDVRVGDLVRSLEDDRIGRVISMHPEAHDLKAVVDYGDGKTQKESVEFVERSPFSDFLNNLSSPELIYYRDLINRLLNLSPPEV